MIKLFSPLIKKFESKFFLIYCSFRIPVSEQSTASGGAIQRGDDGWAHAIEKLCSHWKRKSRGEHTFAETSMQRQLSIVEDAEDTETDPESSGESNGGNMTVNIPSPDDQNSHPSPGGGDQSPPGDVSPSADKTKPVPKPRSPAKTGNVFPPMSPLPPSPGFAVRSPTSPPPVFFPPSHEPGSPAVKIPLAPFIPVPPPLPFKSKISSKKSRTKAFHWDVVGSEKVTLSLY